jgi:radical SAM superfamily enzyme YgiQ (UPF0313 family)
LKKLKVLFVIYDNASPISYFPLGAAYIASAIRDAGHSVEIYNQDIYHHSDAHLANYLNERSFDIVALSACGGAYQHDKIKKICDAIRYSNQELQIWLGGHLAAPEPEYFLKYMNADLIFIGESEISVKNALYELAETGEVKKANGIAFLNENGDCVINPPQSLIENIDFCALPAYDLFPMEHYVLRAGNGRPGPARTAYMLSGRGCIFKCNFCYRMDKGFRARSSASILSEIETLQKRYYITHVSFQDELLMSSRERTISLCNDFIKSGLTFTWECNGRLNFADKDILKLMKDAGCSFINYGIESIDDEALRRMDKSLTVEQIIYGVENTLSVGISPGLNIIFGNIGETSEILDRDVEFLLKYDDHAQLRTIRPVTPYPGSPLYYYAIEKGLLKDCADFYQKSRNSDLLTVNFTDMTDGEFYAAMYKANKRLLENYLSFQTKRNENILSSLYLDLDSSFRGFRKV